jgi:hypothetical protein
MSLELGLFQITSRWQYKYQTDFIWMDYQDMDDIQEVGTPAYPAPTTCPRLQNRVYELTLNLTLADSERQYRCFIVKGGMSYESMADTYTMSRVYEQGIITNPYPHEIS